MWRASRLWLQQLAGRAQIGAKNLALALSPSRSLRLSHKKRLRRSLRRYSPLLEVVYFGPFPEKYRLRVFLALSCHALFQKLRVRVPIFLYASFPWEPWKKLLALRCGKVGWAESTKLILELLSLSFRSHFVFSLCAVRASLLCLEKRIKADCGGIPDLLSQPMMSASWRRVISVPAKPFQLNISSHLTRVLSQIASKYFPLLVTCRRMAGN